MSTIPEVLEILTNTRSGVDCTTLAVGWATASTSRDNVLTPIAGTPFETANGLEIGGAVTIEAEETSAANSDCEAEFGTVVTGGGSVLVGTVVAGASTNGGAAGAGATVLVGVVVVGCSGIVVDVVGTVGAGDSTRPM